MDLFSRMQQVIFLMIIILYASNSYSCTSVFWNNNGVTNIVARSMDLDFSDQPQIVVYPRGISRNGEADENSLTWKSKYGSVAIIELHKKVVSDGLNEHGLAVHLLYLAKTEYPKRDPKIPAISNVLWGQYILDNYKTVQEVLNRINEFQIISKPIQNRTWSLHLTIEDASGDSAVIEFIKGKMEIYHGKGFRIVTNGSPYNIQLTYFKKFTVFGNAYLVPGSIDPLSRFVRVATFLSTLPQPQSQLDTVAKILSVIRTAMVPFGATSSNSAIKNAWPTRWVTVADLNNRFYYFYSATVPNILWLDFRKLNFSELSPILYIDPTKLDLVGEVSEHLSKLKT